MTQFFNFKRSLVNWLSNIATELEASTQYSKVNFFYLDHVENLAETSSQGVPFVAVGGLTACLDTSDKGSDLNRFYGDFEFVVGSPGKTGFLSYDPDHFELEEKALALFRCKSFGEYMADDGSTTGSVPFISSEVEVLEAAKSDSFTITRYKFAFKNFT